MSRCLPTRNSSECAASLSSLVSEEENCCCQMYLVVFFCKDFLLYVFSSKRGLAVTHEVPLVFIP